MTKLMKSWSTFLLIEWFDPRNVAVVAPFLKTSVHVGTECHQTQSIHIKFKILTSSLKYLRTKSTV